MVVTANHWWMDGIVAVAILVASAWLVAGTRGSLTALRRRAARPEPLVGMADEAVVSS